MIAVYIGSDFFASNTKEAQVPGEVQNYFYATEYLCNNKQIRAFYIGNNQFPSHKVKTWQKKFC